MNLYKSIKRLDDTGLVKTIYTLKGWNEWPSNDFDKINLYADVAKIFDIAPDNMLRIPQSHTANVRIINYENTGEGITQNASEGYDGMITNIPQIMLCTVEADCVPVYILDPVNKAIGMIHSGWKGTANKISVNAIRLMQQTYNSNPNDLIICLGPCICGNCYEVGEELINEFKPNFDTQKIESFFTKINSNKYLLNLPQAIKFSLLEAGVLNKNITLPTECTFENSSLCSWRRDKDKTARMLTGIILK